MTRHDLLKALQASIEAQIWPTPEGVALDLSAAGYAVVDREDLAALFVLLSWETAKRPHRVVDLALVDAAVAGMDLAAVPPETPPSPLDFRWVDKPAWKPGGCDPG